MTRRVFSEHPTRRPASWTVEVGSNPAGLKTGEQVSVDVLTVHVYGSWDFVTGKSGATVIS